MDIFDVETSHAILAGYHVVFAIALPFAMPVTYRLGQVLWVERDGLGRFLAVGIVTGVAVLAGISVGLALLGEHDHWRTKYPLAFGRAVIIGIVLAVLSVVADFIVAMVLAKQGRHKLSANIKKLMDDQRKPSAIGSENRSPEAMASGPR